MDINSNKSSQSEKRNSNNTQLLNQNRINEQNLISNDTSQTLLTRKKQRLINQAKITFGKITSSNANPFKLNGTSVNQKNKIIGVFQTKKKLQGQPLYTKNTEALIAKLKIGNVQQKITPALKQNNKKTFSNLDQSYKNQVIKNRNQDTNNDLNQRQIVEYKNQKPQRKPISFRYESEMNAAIKKQENTRLLIKHKANQKKKTLAKLNLKYGPVQKDSLLQSSMKQEIKSRLNSNLDKRKDHNKQAKKIIDELKNQQIEIINKLYNPYNPIQTKQKENNLIQELDSLNYKINAVKSHTAKQKNAANNRYNVIKSKKPSVKRENKMQNNYQNEITQTKISPQYQYQANNEYDNVNYIDSINITTRNNYQYVPTPTYNMLTTNQNKYSNRLKTTQPSVYDTYKGSKKIIYESNKKPIKTYQEEEISREESAISNNTSQTLIV